MDPSKMLAQWSLAENKGCIWRIPVHNKLQLDAARIVTGLPIFTKSEYIYAETGWETLSEWRYHRKLQLFFNIKYGMAPEYLCHLVPPTIQSTTIYPLRNGDNLIVPFCRLYNQFVIYSFHS